MKMRPFVTVLTVLSAAAGLAVLSSGVWLARNYHPHAGGAGGASRSQVSTNAGWIQHVHVASGAVLTAVLVVGVVVGVHAVVRSRRQLAVASVLAVCTIGALGVAWWSGNLLAWTSLALWAVRVNTHIAGVWTAAFDPVIRYVILPGEEVATTDYRARVITHLFAAPMVLLASSLGVVALRWRSRS